jgi:hypothetical protein
MRHHGAMFDWVPFAIGALHSALRGRQAGLAEILLLWQQLAVAMRTHPRQWLRRRDRVFLVVARR